MEDIISTIAWTCGESDCAAQWHKASYWTTPDGYTCDNYSDGDHDSVEEDDLPSAEDEVKSWREYAAYVTATGLDPLDNYFVRHTTKVRERWQFRFNNSIIGPVLIAARRAGRDYNGRELPEHVSQYLGLSKDGRRLTDFANWQAFVEALPDVRPMRWATIGIDHDKPRAAAAVQRELKRLARRTS